MAPEIAAALTPSRLRSASAVRPDSGAVVSVMSTRAGMRGNPAAMNTAARRSANGCSGAADVSSLTRRCPAAGRARRPAR